MTTAKSKKLVPLTHKQKIGVLNAAIDAVETMHGSVTGPEHLTEAKRCGCQYGLTLKGLVCMRREAYAGIQKERQRTLPFSPSL